MARKLDSTSAAIRAARLIEAVAAAERPISLTALVDAVGLPKPTAHRILAELVADGLLSREPAGKRFAVGPRLARIGLGAVINSSTRAERHAILQGLVARIGETCNLTMLDGSEVVYLDRVETAWPLRMNLQPGSHVPTHCSASGKLLLAFLPRARRTRLLAGLPTPRFTDKTIDDRKKLAAELDLIRRRGYATDDEEYLAGVACVAVPVRASRGRVVAAVAVHAPTSRMPLERGLAFVPVLEEAAAALAATLEPAAEAAGEPKSATRRPRAA
ncbi:MAG: IclR family transcriptional regulator [Burkholderiales bacterium]|jgi:DNA-binding IclR family transcriptional regulator|nr:IclR family transcriptional regulator [Burkholderiales bacterium]